MINDKVDENIKLLFESFQNSYQNNFETLIISSEIVFDYVHLLYYRCRKINPDIQDHI